MAIDDKIDIQELVARSGHARQALVSAKAELKYKFNVPARTKQAVRSHPFKFVGGSVVTGYLLKKTLFRKKHKSGHKNKKVQQLKSERGVLMMLFPFALTLAKPAMKAYANRLLTTYFQDRFEGDSAIRPRKHQEEHN